MYYIYEESYDDYGLSSELMLAQSKHTDLLVFVNLKDALEYMDLAQNQALRRDITFRLFEGEELELKKEIQTTEETQIVEKTKIIYKVK